MQAFNIRNVADLNSRSDTTMIGYAKEPGKVGETKKLSRFCIENARQRRIRRFYFALRADLGAILLERIDLNG